MSALRPWGNVVKVDGGRAWGAGVHHLDVHPFLDFGSPRIARTLLKRGRDGKAISALSSRPRFNSAVAIVVGEKSEKGWTSRG